MKKEIAKALSLDWQVTTPRPLAAFYGVAHAKVLAWLRSGDLKGVNLATTTASRPIFRIARSDFDRFWESRAICPQPQPAKRSRARSSSCKQFV